MMNMGKNKAMIPVTARVPEIEQLIRGNPDLIKEYQKWVEACEKQGVAFFDRKMPQDEYGRYRFTIDTRKFGTSGKSLNNEQYDLEMQMISAANPDVKNKTLITYHVTEYPKKALDTFYKMRSLVKGSGESMMLGPGLYGSTNPQVWLSRSEHRLDPIAKLTKPQREKTRDLILKEKLALKGFFSVGELERLHKYLDDFIENGTKGYGFIQLMDQPYNIHPEWVCEKLGVKPHDPHIITFTLKGRYFDLYECPQFIKDLAYLWTETHYPSKRTYDPWGYGLLQAPEHNPYKYFLHDFKFDGAFMRAGWSNTAPMIVVWNRSAIVDAKLERYSVWKRRMW